MNLKHLIDAWNAEEMRRRAADQITLGDLIERLEAMPSDVAVGLAGAHSYRGYYSDLAFERDEDAATATAGDLLAECRKAMGQIFHGYKGGDYPMHANVPVWVAAHGSCGKKLTAINDDGSLELADDE